MKKNIEWLKNEMRIRGRFPAENEYVVEQYRQIMELINQLDEPEKPVIPKYVAEQLEYWERNKMNILWQFWLKEIPSSIMWWLEEDVANYDKMFEAAKYGYEVEEEQKYQVIIRDGEYIRLYLCKHGDNVMIGTNDDYIEKCPEVTYLTEKEIKDYDERFWAFAQEVMEMKKVYEISVHGCDDSTTIEQELTFEEYELLKEVAEKITNTSTYGCMPTMVIREKKVVPK